MMGGERTKPLYFYGPQRVIGDFAALALRYGKVFFFRAEKLGVFLWIKELDNISKCFINTVNGSGCFNFFSHQVEIERVLSDFYSIFIGFHAVGSNFLISRDGFSCHVVERATFQKYNEWGNIYLVFEPYFCSLGSPQTHLPRTTYEPSLQ